MGVQIPHGKGQLWEKGSPIVKYSDFLPLAVQKRLDQSICHLGCGVGWAEGSTVSIAFARRRQCAHMGGYIGVTWRIQQNCPSAGVMRSFVKLLWLLVNTFGYCKFACHYKCMEWNTRLRNDALCPVRREHGSLSHMANQKTVPRILGDIQCTDSFVSMIGRTGVCCTHYHADSRLLDSFTMSLRATHKDIWHTVSEWAGFNVPLNTL